MMGNSNSNSNNIFSTHPRTAERIGKAIKLANNQKITNPLLRRKEFLREIDGIVYGDDPKQGLRQGREFIHKDLGIRFEVPPNFTLFNSTSQVVAKGPRNSIITFELAQKKLRQRIPSLKNYVINNWGRRLSLKKLEKININGLEAITASAQFRGKDYRLIAIRGEKNRIFHLTFVTVPSMTNQLNSAFRRATYSFRYISKSEVDDIKPLRIKLIKFSSSDTLIGIAKKMPFETLQLERLNVLNGLTLGQKPLIGRSLKVVVKTTNKNY